MKPFELEFGTESLHLRLPDAADVLRLPDSVPLPDPAAAIRRAFAAPMDAAPLRVIAHQRRQAHPQARAVIVVSDNTRPVPYRGADGLIEPLLHELREADIRHIEILVATGTHRPMTDGELRQMLPPAVFEQGLPVINHVCTDRAALAHLGRTGRGTEIWVNRRYVEADIKILTGLVEPHFMAGVSGGPKSICPGLIGEDATFIFHGARTMADPGAVSLRLEGNPCQTEAQEVARAAGSDFVVNVTVNRDRRLTGVFAGALDPVHRAAAARVQQESIIPIAHPYDLVITHGGFVGINHYQAAKSAVEATPAVTPGGTLILAANHTDRDPVGGANYKRLMPLFTRLGHEAFERQLLAPDWTFVPEQWEFQMWARALRKLGSAARLIYCAPQLTGETFRAAGLFGTDGGAGLTGLTGRPLAEAMVQRALDTCHAAHPAATIAILADGPYGVPRVQVPV